MKEFINWLEKRDQKIYENLSSEGFLSKAMAGPMMALTAMGGVDLTSKVNHVSLDKDALEYGERRKAAKRDNELARDKARPTMPVKLMKKR